MGKEEWLAIIKMILIFTLFFLCTYVVKYIFEKEIQCPRIGNNLELETKYDYWGGGCFIKYENQWIDTDNFRVGKID